jgi:hypothetical protein
VHRAQIASARRPTLLSVLCLLSLPLNGSAPHQLLGATRQVKRATRQVKRATRQVKRGCRRQPLLCYLGAPTSWCLAPTNSLSSSLKSPCKNVLSAQHVMQYDTETLFPAKTV